MDRTSSTLVTAGLLVLLLALMYLGWRARTRRQAGVPQPAAVPADIGRSLGEFEGFYVSTTVADEPLNRIAVRGLGFRSRATVTVAERGIVLSLAGTPDIFLPRSDLRGVTRATVTIDRVVERGGLVLVAWTIVATGGIRTPTAATDPTTSTDVDSYLRLERSQELIDAITQILPTPTGRTA